MTEQEFVRDLFNTLYWQMITFNDWQVQNPDQPVKNFASAAKWVAEAEGKYKAFLSGTIEA